MPAQQYSMVIDLRWCLDELLADKLIDQRGYNLVITSRRNKAQHLLLTISEFALTNGHACGTVALKNTFLKQCLKSALFRTINTI